MGRRGKITREKKDEFPSVSTAFRRKPPYSNPNSPLGKKRKNREGRERE